MSKVWRFYKKPTEEMKKYSNKELRLDVKYPLYAVTHDKKLASMFRKTRNMDLFLEKVSSIDKEELEDYLRTHDHSELDIYKLSSYKDKNMDTQEPITTYVCMTKSEYDYTTEASETGGVLSLIKGWVPIEIFTPKIKKILYKFGYQKCQQFVFQGEIPFSEDVTDGFGYYDLGYEFDELGVFVLLYQDTFSEEFFNHVKIKSDLTIPFHD